MKWSAIDHKADARQPHLHLIGRLREMAKNYIRGREGVLSSLCRDGDIIRLDLDDAEGSKAKFPSHWKTISPYTSIEFESEKLLNMELSADEFARVGENLVARLVASLKAYE